MTSYARLAERQERMRKMDLLFLQHSVPKSDDFGRYSRKNLVRIIARHSLKDIKGKLARLPKHFYCGLAYVFWTHTTENRQSLPLSQAFHAHFRELLCHTCARYQLATPVYCLMPDHFHIFWIGQSPDSDQLNATKFFRKELTPHLGASQWQRQAHDHVVTSDEREKGIYQDTIHYMLQNPVRAGIVEDWRTYPYTGALIPGYPRLERTAPEFNEQFWKIYQYTITR